MAPVATVDVVKVVAVFFEVFGIRVVESETVSARFDFSDAVVAFPVFVAGNVMRVEAVVVRTFKVFLLCRT